MINFILIVVLAFNFNNSREFTTQTLLSKENSLFMLEQTIEEQVKSNWDQPVYVLSVLTAAIENLESLIGYKHLSKQDYEMLGKIKGHLLSTENSALTSYEEEGDLSKDDIWKLERLGDQLSLVGYENLIMEKSEKTNSKRDSKSKVINRYKQFLSTLEAPYE